MKKMIITASCVLMLAACDKMAGQLNITKEFSLKNTKGQTQTLSVGSYSTILSALNSKKLELALNDSTHSKFIFDYSSLSTLPENKEIILTSEDSGQPVDLKFTLKTAVTNSPLKEKKENCQYQKLVYFCDPIPGGPQNCSYKYQTIYGRKTFSYYDKTTTKDIVATVKEAHLDSELADYHGSSLVVERVISDLGVCH